MSEAADRLIAEGNRAEQAGRLHEARKFYRDAADSAPGYAKAHVNLGIVLEALGEHDAAIASYERALSLDGSDAYAAYNLGKLLYARGALPRAEALLAQALRSRPQFPEARVVRALVLQAQARPQAALAELEAALRLRPDDPAALYHHADLLTRLNRLDAAHDALRRLVAVDPASVEAHARLADIYVARDQLAAAALELEAVLRVRPDWVEALFNYGSVLKKLMRPVEAEAAFRRVIAADPGHAGAYRMLGSTLLGQCLREAALEAYRAGAQRCPEDLRLASGELFALLGSDEISDQALFERHVAFGARIERAYPPRRAASFRNRADPERRLRIGYVSGDFGYHVVTLFLLPPLERRDRAACEVFCYSTGGRADQYARQLAAAADVWREAAALTEAQLAEAVEADQIDILVDLAGHSGVPQLALFARQPAPVQATWLGYLNTTGMTRMQYRITDRFADPPGLTERLHTESLVRLPHSQWSYRPFVQAAPAQAPAFERSGHVTFGSFTQAAKLTPSTRALWAQILARLPQARLVVLGVPAGRAQDDLWRDLAQAGVARERVTLAPYAPLEEYFRWFDAVDIALDATPYSGATTTCDALWMGVPVVTLPGARPASRSAASILSSVGLSGWISASAQDYVARSVRYAGERATLAELRATLRTRMLASPLMDEARFARDLELAYRQMWRRWCAERSA